MIDAEPAKVSQAVFANAAAARDAKELLTHLEQLPAQQFVIDDIAALIRRSGALIHLRPDAAGQARRDAFLFDLRAHLQARVAGADWERFDAAVRLVATAEDGHHRILHLLGRTAFAAEPAPIRAAAIIARTEASLAALVADTEAALKATGRISMPGGPDLRDANGRRASADAVVSAMVASLGGTLKMEGFANRWFDRKTGQLILPMLPAVGTREVELAGQSEFLSMSWIRWERLHETARYEDSDIELLHPPALPEDCPPGFERVYARQHECETLDFIANERSIAREGISAADLSGSTGILSIGKGIEGTTAASPVEYVSTQEALNVLSLSEAVGYEIIKDLDRPGGLRLTQWVRGYMCLQELASSSRDPQSGLLQVSAGDFADLLQRASLTADEAAIFLDAVTFGKDRRDLFDAPVIRTKGDWLLVGPALAAPRMAKIVPSLLASMEIQLRRKGMAFEQRVIELLCGQGLDARRVKVTRDGADYEYDVLAPWGNYVLHFECKNHGLSGNDPIQSFHFLQEIGSGIEQVGRLRNALVAWPEILTDAFGPEVAGKTVVHCLLENDTYCIPGGVDGVYVYDWSALSRFFEAGWLRVMHDHKLPGNIVVRNRVGVKRIWQGETPTPEDLIAEMENPSQFRIVAHHLEVHRSGFQLDETTIAIDYTLFARPITNVSMAEALGFSATEVEQQLAQVDGEIAKAKERLAGVDGEG